MRHRYRRTQRILHFNGLLLQTLGVVFLFPLILVAGYWGRYGDGPVTAYAFAVPAVASFVVGWVFRRVFTGGTPGTAGSMIICGLGWVFASAFGALPFVIALKASYLSGYFEAMSGFTTTGITVFSGLDQLPRSILFWRALTQWVGGIGILSFFLVITFKGGGAHHIYGAESHKIASTRPVPGILHTVKILWGIYGGFTLAGAVVLALMKMHPFDALCHALASLSTGGFSPHDASIAYYGQSGHPHFKLIEYTVTLLMMLGGINFLVHYRVLTRDVKALWDNVEIRTWWRFVAGFVMIIMFDNMIKTGMLATVFSHPGVISLSDVETVFRRTSFQVTSVLTTTGFSTQDIGSAFFPALSRQLFLAMMVIGGCVGSTGGGFKVMRVVILERLMLREIFKLRAPAKASKALIIDKRPVPAEEAHRTAALFFTWLLLIGVGGGITALFSNHGAFESLSGMFSALGNIGPCYISNADLITLSPVVKITYIFGMLAGRLEILPVLLIFSRKAWRG
jgi:trk system potassium uptake protein TrkH